MSMDRRSVLRLVGSATIGSIAAGTAAAHGDDDHDPATIAPQTREQLAEVRQATSKYQDPDVAKADGYTPVHGCVEDPYGSGAMGVHFVNPSLRGDGEVTVTEPEVLLYEPTDDGYDLAGVEYVANTDDVGGRPELFGQTFHGPMPAHTANGERHYELHVWCWKANPDGMFAPFHPNIDC